MHSASVRKLSRLVAACLMLAAAGCAPSQPRTSNRGAAHAATLPSQAKASEVNLFLLGSPLTVDLGKGWVRELKCLVGPKDEIWLFALLSGNGSIRLVSAFHGGTKWSPVTEMVRSEENFRWAIVPVWLKRGEPALLWAAGPYDDSVCPLRMYRWAGQAWSSPEDTRGMVAVSMNDSLTALTTTEGDTTVFYIGRFVPPEAYRVGVDAWFPHKLFSIRFAEGKWQEPIPVTPQSRWSYRAPFVFEHDGRRHLLGIAKYASRLALETDELEYRVLDADGQWSDATRVSDPAGRVAGPLCGTVANDGTVHVVYYNDFTENKIQPTVARYRTLRRNLWSKPVYLGSYGYSACIGRDTLGNVYLSWLEQSGPNAVGRMKLLTPEGKSLSCEIERGYWGRIYTAPDEGVILVSDVDVGTSTTIRVQKVTASARQRTNGQ